MAGFALLTSVENGAENVYTSLPVMVAGVCAVLLLIAFFVGCKKGVRRVSWGGFVWMFAAGGFLLLEKRVFAKENPLANVFSDMVDMLMQNATQSQRAQVTQFCGSFALAAICCVAALVLYGLCSLLFRPKVLRVKKNADIYTLDEEGVRYDEEYYDYDDYEEYESRTKLRFKGYGTPSLFARIVGGLVCVVNTAAVIAVVMSVAVFLVGATSLRETALGAIYEQPMVAKLAGLAESYALDVAFIGIIIGFACKGCKTGFMETIRALIASFGGLVGVAAAFYLSFTAAEGGGFLWTYVSRCIAAANVLCKGALSAEIVKLLGQALAGLILTIFIIILLKLIDLLLKKLSESIYANGISRRVDGVIACAIYFVVGIVVIVAIWAAFFVLSYYGIFHAEKLFTEKSALSSGLFSALDAFLTPLLANI